MGNYMVFANTLEDLLEERDITLRMLSKEIGVPFQMLYDYKNIGYFPSIRVADKIVKYFNCSLNYLLGIDNYRDNKCYNDINLSLFYDRYIELLQKNNVSHYHLYKTIGLNNSSVTKWKNGAIPKVESLIKIANYFKVSIDYLAGKTDMPY